MTSTDRFDYMRQMLRRGISRQDAHYLNGMIDVEPTMTLGSVSEVLHQTAMALWEAFDTDAKNVDVLRDLLCTHRYALLAAAAALDFEAAAMEEQAKARMLAGKADPVPNSEQGHEKTPDEGRQ